MSARKGVTASDVPTRLTIIRRTRPKYVLCRCSCGTEKEILKQSVDEGHTKSCGCLQRELASQRSVTHGRSESPIYALWRAMIARCTNPNDGEFSRYGGRGITVCDRWQGDNGFENFLADMGERPKGMQLDRIDNGGNYEPSNVRWSTPKDNARNRRSNRHLECDGVSRTLAEWAERLGVSSAAILMRLKAGWSVKDAVTTPKTNRYSR